MFKCEYCGQEYNTPAERARCELECNDFNEKAREEAKKKAALAEQEAARKKISEMIDEYKKCEKAIEQEILSYNKKYGVSYKTDRLLDDWWDVIMPFGGFCL